MNEKNSDSDSGGLLSRLASVATDRILRAISGSDYGSDFQKHLDILLQIRAGMHSFDPSEYYWFPLEVLELTRWMEPEEGQYHRVIPVYDWHIARALSCAVMLRVGGDYPEREYMGDSHETLIQLISSVEVLGREYEIEAFRFVCWRISCQHDPEELPYWLVTAIYLHLKLFDHPDGAWLDELSSQALAAEQSIHRIRSRIYEPGWLLPLTLFDQKHHKWRQLFGQLASMIQIVEPEMTSSLYELQVCVGA